MLEVTQFCVILFVFVTSKVCFPSLFAFFFYIYICKTILVLWQKGGYVV